MILRGLQIEGLAGLRRFSATGLDRVVRVGGSPAALTALSDALGLALGAFRADDLRRAFARLGADPDVPEPGRLLPEELHLRCPERLRAWLDPAAERKLRVQLELELDPPQFRLLRDLALRDPSLSTGLGEGVAHVQLTLGWLFTQDLSVVASSMLALRLGDVELRPSDERLALLEPLLRSLGGRGLVRDLGESCELDYALAERSADPERRARAARMREALTQPPFSWGTLGVVDLNDGKPWLTLGPGLASPRDLGPGCQQDLKLCDAVFLSGAEILVLREPAALSADPDGLLRWLEEQAEGAGAPLEQVFLLSARGENQTLRLSEEPSDSPLREPPSLNSRLVR